MEYKFHLKKRITDMENPSRNRREEKTIYADVNETFEEDPTGKHIFKILEGGPKSIKLEYNRGYAVKNEHRGYEFVTELILNVPKKVTSMWGKDQTTIEIVYLGINNDD